MNKTVERLNKIQEMLEKMQMEVGTEESQKLEDIRMEVIETKLDILNKLGLLDA